MKTWTIYALVCIVTNEVKYVGLTSTTLEQRLQSHLRGKDYNPGKAQWIRDLRSEGILPIIIALEIVTNSLSHARIRERYWTYKYIEYGHDLLNIKYIPEPRKAFFQFLRNQPEVPSATEMMHQYPPGVSGTTPQ